MALATVAAGTPPPRAVELLDLSIAELVITLTATTYTAASGGIPFDIASVLNNIGPFPQNGIDPYDVYFIRGFGSVNGDTTRYVVTDFTLGTPTWSAVPNDIVNPEGFVLGTLATAPCTARLFGTGASSAAALGQIANGDLTGTLTVVLAIARSGHQM